jgi:hypothetical protein
MVGHHRQLVSASDLGTVRVHAGARLSRNVIKWKLLDVVFVIVSWLKLYLLRYQSSVLAAGH